MAKKPVKKVPKKCKYEGTLDEKTGLITWKSHKNAVTALGDPPPPPIITPGPRS